MVPDHLNRVLRQTTRLLRRPGTGILLATTSTLVLVLSLVGFTAEKSGDQLARKPSLLDLLDEVARDAEQKDVLPGLPPKAPKAASWSSPLARQCSGIDQSMRRRLLAKRRKLPELRQAIPADPSNYGDRYRRNPWGQTINPVPRVVILHETVYSLNSAVNTFLTPHPRDEDQVSYHTLVGLDGSIVDVVDPLKRAYGAGYSAFLGEWAVTNAEFDGSVNNFALHLSLETPDDGHGTHGDHSGYTEDQYDALALVLDGWLERFEIDPAAITTHKHVDLGGARADPRNFSWSDLQSRLAALGKLCHA
jgi:N-acetyl-anhydromuramyl-L-alanine amidase AmpD|tara:strand:+ start:301 stop:1218 length:918 start_codon:yes stop_codon:yes gene_type:complete